MQPYKDAMFNVISGNVGSQDWMGWAKRKDFCLKVYSGIDAEFFGFQELTPEASKEFSFARMDMEIVKGVHKRRTRNE